MRISQLKNLSDDSLDLLPIAFIGAIGIVWGLITSPTSPISPNNPNNISNNSVEEIATGITDNDFNKALPHILKWEGKCSDHWADNGGKTYMGITREVAKKHGFNDPCTMTKEQVYGVYHKDYWVRVPKNLDFPRKLAYFNMIVNGTKQGCLTKPTAIAMLDCQADYYKGLSDAPHFLAGWLNRNNDIKSVVE
jgi:Glycosyl hydrolase 108